MKQYRNKSVVIEAMQINDDNLLDLLKLSRKTDDLDVYCHTIGERTVTPFISDVQIKTTGGTVTGEKGDWLIRGESGEYYPCKPDIFEATYEPADTK